MKLALTHGVLATAVLLIIPTQTWAAELTTDAQALSEATREGIHFGHLGREWEMMYDAGHNLLVLLGNDGDNHMEVVCMGDGSLRFTSESTSATYFFKQTPALAIHGGEGSDCIIGHQIPVLAINGGPGEDILIWDHAGTEEKGGTQDINIGIGELQECTISKSMDMGFHEVTYAGDLILWNESTDGSESVFGGAGLDILIGNTGGDRNAIYSNLGEDWLVGGTERSGSDLD